MSKQHGIGGIAFVRKGDTIRGTFDGRYTVMQRDRDATDEDITDRLRSEFARGNSLPITSPAEWEEAVTQVA